MSLSAKFTPAPTFGQEREDQLLKDAHSFVYHETPQGSLLAHLFLPPGHNPAASHYGCIVFLHGGLWDASMATQFVPHCHHFASRGMIAVTLEYRVFNKHRANPLEAEEDTRAALVFLHQNAAEIGIDPERIVLAGGGSGAHLALLSALKPSESHPPVAAVAGYSSLVDVTSKDHGRESFSDKKTAKASSPMTHVPAKELPPCLLVHGGQDRIAPMEDVSKFARLYRKKKNVCKLIGYESAGHTFFNYNTNEQMYELSLQALDFFLVECKLLPAEEPLVF